MLETTTTQTAETLASFHRQLLISPQATVYELVSWLDGVQRAAGEKWPQLCVELRPGALHESLLEDPFTERAFRKPRGYPGDAVMMDHIYDHASILSQVEKATPLGRDVRGFSATGCLSARAVRWRREAVARRIEALVQERGSIDVLAFACGHLRELELLDEDCRSHVRFVAADGDAESLAEIERIYRGRGTIDCRQLTVKELLTLRSRDLDRFDFVYTLGLLDYMTDRAAERIAQRLWSFLKPKGRLLVANFSVDTATKSYMEVFMDWWLMYRTTSQVRLWAAGLEDLGKWETFQDPWRQVIYLSCERRP
jgi:SAM-dependent methyltransferase